MRIGLVCPYDLGTPGGVQAQVLGLAAALRRRGHEAEVLAPGRPAGNSTVANSTVVVGRSIPIQVNGSTARMAPHPAAAWRTRQAVRQRHYDVVHLHEPLAPSITLAALVSSRVPVVGTFHAAGEGTPYRWIGGSLHHLAGRIDRRVAVSEPAAQLAQRHLGGSYTVLFNGIEPKPHHTRCEPLERAPVVLFLGRHEPRKGLEVLLDAVSLLPESVTVWVAGEGPDTARLRRRHAADGRVQWLGRLTEADKWCRLRDASVLCVPSLGGESFGVVLLEAMAVGTPVVASDIMGYRALAGATAAACLVPPGDPAGLAARLLAVLGDQATSARLRSAGHTLAAAHSFDALARRYLEVYAGLT